MGNLTLNDIIEALKIILYLGGLIFAFYKIPSKINAIIIKSVSEKIDPLSIKIDENEIGQLRFQILSFASDLRNGVNKTRQEFETIFMFYDKYEEILKRLNRHNGYLDTEFDYIKLKYIEQEGGKING